MKLVVRVALLTALWVLLWGDISVANVASGALVAVALMVLYPTRSAASGGRNKVRPLAVARLVLHIVVQLVVSNAVVAREIVTPRSRIRTGIVACRLRTRSDGMIAFLADVLALSPGTMPVDIGVDPPTIYVHVLHLRDPQRSRREVATLEALAIRAFGSDEEVAGLAADRASKVGR